MSYYRNQRVADDERPGQQPLPSDTAIPVPALLSLLDSYPFWTDEQQVLGTRKRRTPEHLPGLGSHLDDEFGLAAHEHARRHNRRGNVQVPLSRDARTDWLRRVLVYCVRNGSEIWGSCRRLGLPKTSIANKSPHWQDAMQRPDTILLDRDLRRLRHARESGWLGAGYHHSGRKPPKFRTRPPGLKTVIAANFLFIYVLLIARV